MFQWGEAIIAEKQNEKYLEVVGVAEGSGIETWRVLTLNYLYTLSAFCTSIVARQ